MNSTEEDLPVITPTTLATGDNAYVKPSLSYLGLKDMFKVEAFKKYLHVYMDRWNGKHPILYNFFIRSMMHLTSP
jgi:hypothetical protein